MDISFKIIFWLLFAIAVYAYIGYGLILYIIIKLKRIFRKKKEFLQEYEPEVTLFVAAYNEKDYVDAKLNNHFNLNYPKEKVKHLWVTDGSNDGTPELLKTYPNVEVHHENARGGKIGALNRGMSFVKTPIVIFSDGNTMLGENSIKIIVDLFKDPKVGCVAGEKRIASKQSDAAAGSGEGIYWKYESALKRWDAELYSAVGAAGELFAIRTELFEKVEADTLLDDFVISLRIVKKGYKIQYNPEAYAIETASADVKEELKRKIRIAAGGIQSIVRLKDLLNPLKYGLFSFQYISHKVLRWLIVPFSLPIILLSNFAIVYNIECIKNIYGAILILQILFYFLVLNGWILKNLKIKIKILFVPYYIFIMNYATWLGLFRYIKGKQSVNWERAKRGK
jgi:cellulose synthase/poly-beta-1,6-N-acetylglucosamine synthase-like glycosyltransferase